MNETNVEIGEMRLSIVDGDGDANRAENIARLTLELLRELMEREWQHVGADAVIDFGQVPPIAVSLATMDDETVARTCAPGIYRFLMAAH